MRRGSGARGTPSVRDRRDPSGAGAGRRHVGGREPLPGRLSPEGPLIDWPRLNREAAELLERFRVDVDPECPVRALGVGRKQQVEILKAVRRRSRVLILDEPTAALGEAESRDLLELVRRLARQGVACLYITHRLDEVRAIADRITVLRDGRSIVAFPTGEVSPRDLIRAMAGRPVSESSPRPDIRRWPGSTAAGGLLARGRSPARPDVLARGTSAFEVRAGKWWASPG